MAKLNWDSAPDVSINISGGFYDENLESCWGTFAVMLTENSHGGMQPAVGVLVSHKGWEDV